MFNDCMEVQDSLAISTNAHKPLLMNLLSLYPRPLPPGRGLVHTACACTKYFVIFSIQSSVHFLVLKQKIMQTKNTELSSATIKLAEPRRDTTFQMWQYHFSKRTALQKGTKSIYQKGPLVATENLSLFVHGLGIFPLRQFPLCQFPLRQFPFGQLPTLSIPIWSMLTKWELTKWELTKWEVDEVGKFTIVNF